MNASVTRQSFDASSLHSSDSPNVARIVMSVSTTLISPISAATTTPRASQSRALSAERMTAAPRCLA
jgi:hypothetical protein